MSEEEAAGESGRGNEMANELKERVSGLDLQDKLAFGGAAAYVVLAWLTWWRQTVDSPLVKHSVGIDGLEPDVGKIAWVAALLLASFYVVPPVRQFVTDKIKEPARGFVPLGLGALTFLLGPLNFMRESGKISDGMGEMMEAAGVDMGKTFFFWLAFLAAAAAVGGPAWKKFGGPGG